MTARTRVKDNGYRPRNAAETRKRILEAALDQFSEHTYVGARIDVIAKKAGFNTRMLYHYFGDKAGLYVAVLESVLGNLRREELNLRTETVPPVEGILQMFDFIYRHFGENPQLVNLMSGENLMRAEFIKNSVATPNLASPVLNQVTALLKRGEKDKTIRKGIPPLHLYVLMVGMSYFHRSNGFSLSAIFRQDVTDESWQRRHHRFARSVLETFITSEDE